MSRPAVTLFFCGCDPCAKTVRDLGRDRVSSATVVFAGSPGDASEFVRRWGLSGTVFPDLDGSVAKSRGIVACPAAIIEAEAGPQVVGNAKRISATEMQSVREVLDAR